MSEVDDTWVDDVLYRAQPVTGADLADMDLAAGFDQLLSEVLAADTSDAVLLPRRRGRRAVVSLVVAGAMLTTGGVAAAVAMRGTLTGLFGQAGNSENDTSEYVDATKPDFPQLARQLGQQLQQDGLQFAPGYSPQDNIDSAIATMQRSGGQQHSLIQITGVKGRIADIAGCTWERRWLTAFRSQDDAAMTASVAGMRQTAGLTIMSQINAADWLSGLADAAAGGDAHRVQADVTVNCSTVVK